MPLQRSSTGLGFLWYSIQIHRFGFPLVCVIFFVSWGLKAIDPQVLVSCDLLDPDPLVWVSISPCYLCSQFGFPLIQSAVSIYMFGFPLIQSAGLIYRFGFPLIQSAVSIYRFWFPLIQSAFSVPEIDSLDFPSYHHGSWWNFSILSFRCNSACLCYNQI